VRSVLLTAAVTVSLALPAGAAAMGNPEVAALQVALHGRGLYAGTIDGVAGPGTSRAVRVFQRQAGLAADGVAGPATRRALGRRWRRRLGTRQVRVGMSGSDVASLQFLLAWHGFPSGPMDGGFGLRTDAALRRFQRWARMAADGVAGSRTVAALRSRPHRHPIAVLLPLSASRGDGFGPRGVGFHTGIDFPAPAGRAVRAAAHGRFTWAGWREGGWGYLVSIAHGGGVRTMYAHLSSISVRRGQRVGAGDLVGAVGASGHATGPHLHFEMRLRGAAVDPGL
jgi:murein DD-endopeptidase MepM/ murein hydrolase activator NlpD